jgi:micrococcal nuclease
MKRSSAIPFAAAALTAIGIGIWNPSMPVRSQENRSPSAFIAIDGDTIKSPAGVKYRLLGFDAPETYLAKCIEELDKGTAAKRRLQQLIDTGKARLVESGKLDKYRRMLATLYVAGADVATTLIAEGLARPYAGGKREGWCPTVAQ